MPHPHFSAQEIAARAQDIYERQVRALVDVPANKGKFLVLDIESGEYELDADRIAASNRAAAKHPGGALFAMRVGYPTLGRIGIRAGSGG